jgi:hypothetical protein
MNEPETAREGGIADDSRRVLLGLAGIGGVAALAGIARGGPLNPPVGAVAGTGRSLTEVYDKVETRPDAIPINATNTPGSNGVLYVIQQPGRYYFPAGSGAIYATTPAGVLDIRASNVDVDLNGRTLASADSNFTSVLRMGVGTPGVAGNIRVRNGTLLRGENSSSQVNGIKVDNPLTDGLTVEDVRFVGCSLMNAWTGALHGLTLRRCTFLDCGTYAVQMPPDSVGTVLEDCVLVNPTLGVELGDSSRVERCVMEYNGAGTRSIGVRVGSSSVVRGCQITGYGSASQGAIACVDGCLIERNVVRRAIGGVRTGFGCTVADNVIEGSSGATNGIYLGAINNRVMRNHVSLFGAGVAGPAGSQIVINNTFAQVGSGVTVNATNSLIGTFINAGNMATQANPYANMYV